MSELSRADFDERLAKLVTDQPEIRTKLLDDPKAVIEEMLDMELSAEINVAVHEEDADTLHFVLPPPGDELTAAELAGVSGGLCWEHEVPPNRR